MYHAPSVLSRRIPVRKKPRPDLVLRACRPTRCPPGSEGKLKVMRLRARLKQPLFHPQDATLRDSDGFAGELAGGDNAFRLALIRQGADGNLERVEVNAERTRRQRTEQEKQKAATEEARSLEAERKRLERQRKRDGKRGA